MTLFHSTDISQAVQEAVTRLGRVTVVVDLSGIVPTSLEEAQCLLREQIKLDEAKLAVKKEELAAINQTIREIGNVEG